MDFQERFKEKMNQINKELGEKAKPKPRIKLIPLRVEIPLGEILYNIHKRSLPPEIDYPIMFNLLKEEAERWVRVKLLHKRVYKKESDKYIIIYYDMVPQDGDDHSIYENSGPLIKEEKDQEIKLLDDVRVDFID